MKDISELVDLPDPAVQPLVHPLDVPEARRRFREAWLVGALTSPPVAICAAVLIWFAGSGFFWPIAIGLMLILIGPLAGRYMEAEAWAHIPRRRQDRGRPLPVAWELGSALMFAALLSAVLLLAAFWLRRPGVMPDVRAVTFGMGAAAGLTVVLGFAVQLVLRRGARRPVLLTLPGVVAVAGCVVASYAVLFGDAGPSSVALTAWGGAGMLVAWALATAARRAGLVR